MTGDLIRTGKRALPQQGHLEHPEVDKSRSRLGAWPFKPHLFQTYSPQDYKRMFVCLFALSSI